MRNTKKLLIRLGILAAVAAVIALVMVVQNKNKKTGENFLRSTVWEMGSLSVMTKISFGEDTVDIKKNGILEYSGTYEVNPGTKKIKFIFKERPKDTDIQIKETASYEYENGELTINFSKTQWCMSMTENTGVKEETVNAYWKGVEGKYKDYDLLMEEKKFYVIEKESDSVVGEYEVEFQSNMVLTDMTAESYTWEKLNVKYSLEKGKLIIGDDGEETVFEKRDNSRHDEILKRAEEQKLETIQFLGETVFWKAQQGDQIYEMELRQEDSSFTFEIYEEGEGKALLTKGTIYCGLGKALAVNSNFLEEYNQEDAVGIYCEAEMERTGEGVKVSVVRQERKFSDSESRMKYKVLSEELISGDLLFVQASEQPDFVTENMDLLSEIYTNSAYKDIKHDWLILFDDNGREINFKSGETEEAGGENGEPLITTFYGTEMEGILINAEGEKLTYLIYAEWANGENYERHLINSVYELTYDKEKKCLIMEMEGETYTFIADYLY